MGVDFYYDVKDETEEKTFLTTGSASHALPVLAQHNKTFSSLSSPACSFPFLF